MELEWFPKCCYSLVHDKFLGVKRYTIFALDQFDFCITSKHDNIKIWCKGLYNLFITFQGSMASKTKRKHALYFNTNKNTENKQ